MNINFATIPVNRLIMHQIIAKVDGQEFASVNYETALLNITNDVKDTIRERLVDAGGKQSRAFDLEIGNSSPDTFFDLAKDIKNLSDPEFITRSQEIADLLASSQKRNNIPGGYIIIIDCTRQDRQGMYVVIKAELHNALKYERSDGISNIQLLREVFLSPSQKLYKFGILYEQQNDGEVYPNDQFSCFLFDDQFRADGRPAEYFYEDFLGFSIGKNAKIQTKRFFDNTLSFISRNITDVNNRTTLMRVLKDECSTNLERTITPSEFSNSYFDDQQIKDQYTAEVANHLPPSIIKDITLIENQLSKRKIFFPNNINVVGPDDSFDNRVKIISSQEELNQLAVENVGYTLLKIEGKPYSND